MIFCGVDTYFSWQKGGQKNFAVQKGDPENFSRQILLHQPPPLQVFMNEPLLPHTVEVQHGI